MNRPYCVTCDAPKVGQIWQDNDPRGGPTIRITRICEGPGASCPSSYLGAHAHVVSVPGDKRPRTVLLRRFKPGRNGYSLKDRSL